MQRASLRLATNAWTGRRSIVTVSACQSVLCRQTATVWRSDWAIRRSDRVDERRAVRARPARARRVSRKFHGKESDEGGPPAEGNSARPPWQRISLVFAVYSSRRFATDCRRLQPRGLHKDSIRMSVARARSGLGGGLRDG